jgi:hypothetical protein
MTHGKLNAAGYRIADLSAVHASADFQCTDPQMCAWLRDRALLHERLGMSRTFVLEPTSDAVGSPRVCGFFSISMSSVNRDDVHSPPPEAYSKLPVLLLGQLARDRRIRTITVGGSPARVGELLVAEAFRRATALRPSVGFCAVYLNAKNEKLASYYESMYDFVRTKRSKPLQGMYLELGTLTGEAAPTAQ